MFTLEEIKSTAAKISNKLEFIGFLSENFKERATAIIFNELCQDESNKVNKDTIIVQLQQENILLREQLSFFDPQDDIEVDSETLNKIISESKCLRIMKANSLINFETITLKILNDEFNIVSNFKNCVNRLANVYLGNYPLPGTNLFMKLLNDAHYLESSKETDLLILLHYSDHIDILKNCCNGINIAYNSLKEGISKIYPDELTAVMIKFGSVELLKYKNISFSDDDFLYATVVANISVVKYIWKHDKKYLYNSDYEAFTNVCRRGDKELVEWMYEYYTSTKKFKFNRQYILYLCKGGNLYLVKWLYNIFLNNNVSLSKFDFSMFFGHCFKSGLEINQWIYNKCIELGGVINFNMITAIGVSLLGLACKTGNIELVKWIISLGVNVHINNDDPFQHACLSGNIELARMIWNDTKDTGTMVDLHANYECAFENACMSENVELVMWLWELALSLGTKINLDQEGQDDRCAIIEAYESHDLALFQYVHNLYLQEKITIDYKGFIEDYGEKNFNINRWVRENGYFTLKGRIPITNDDDEW